jgi:hypothetical protein
MVREAIGVGQTKPRWPRGALTGITAAITVISR